MLRQLLAQADRRLQIFAAFQPALQIGELKLTLAHQIADAVERHAAVIADDAPAPVAVRQTGQHAGFAAAHHLRRIDVKHALVVGFAQVGKQVFKLRIHLPAIGFERAADHVDPAVRMQGALERLVGLQADDRLQILVDVGPARGP